MPGARLVLAGLAKAYGDQAPAVASLSLEVEPGELIGLLGPSGCGKTTTLRMIGGLVASSAGKVIVDGQDVTRLPPHKRDMGVVFQNYALFPHMTVAANVGFGLQMRDMPKDKLTWRVARALEMVRLGGLGDRRPSALSGGQQQRVALARALVIEPSILLLDEPLSNLDANLREEMRVEIREIQRRLGITTVFVTHDQSEALAMCDRIAVMRAGRLEQIGRPYEIYEQPRTPFVAEFVGRVNRMEGQRSADGGLAVNQLALRGPAGPPGPVTVMVRPHRIAMSTDPTAGRDRGPEWNMCGGRVRRVTYIGSVEACDVENDSGMLTVEQPTASAAARLRGGEAVTLAWRVADTLVFPRTAA